MKRKNFSLFLLPILLLLAREVSAQEVERSGNSITPEVEQLMAEHKIPGVVITVIKDHKVLFTNSFGIMDEKTKAPVTEATVFQVASMSKAVTAVGVMQLVQDGHLDLDADVNARLQTWKIKENRFNRGHAITLRQLLTHTAGMNNGPGRLGFPGIPPSHPLPTPLELLEGRYGAFYTPIPKVKSIYPPGEDFHYSGAGYTIIQQIVAETTQQPFPALMDSLIFSPLQMSSSTFEQNIETKEYYDQLASGHKKSGKVLKHKRQKYPEMAAAGLFTTSGDLAKLLIELQRSYLGESDSLLSQQTTKEMFTKVRVPSGKQWALGWNFYDGPDGNPIAWFHNGSVRGFRSFMMVQPEGGYGLIILTNSNNGKELIEPIRQKVFKSYFYN